MLIEDQELRNRLGRAARVRALQRFDEQRVTDIVVAEYRRLLARKGISGTSGPKRLAVSP